MRHLRITGTGSTDSHQTNQEPSPYDPINCKITTNKRESIMIVEKKCCFIGGFYKFALLDFCFLVEGRLKVEEGV